MWLKIKNELTNNGRNHYENNQLINSFLIN